MNRKFGLLTAFGLALLMAACTPTAASQPTEEQPTDEPTTEVTDQPTEAPEVDETAEPALGIINQEALLAAQEALAAQLGVDVSELEVALVEHTEWSDGCLGLGGPAESCLAAIVPGWRVVLSADGTEYEVRTDETGEVVRINLNAAEGSSDQAVAEATKALAAHLSIEEAEIEVVQVEHVEWSDGCLGLGGPEEMCMAAIVPGWRVILSADDAEYEVRTDETGTSVRVNTGEEESPSN